LFRLPGELRKDIYRLAIVSPDLVLVDSTGVPEPALLSVSKHVRSEAITIDYKENTFNIDIIDFNSAVCVRMSQKKRQLRYRHQISPRCFCSSLPNNCKPNRANLLLWLRRYHEGCVDQKIGSPSELLRANELYDAMYLVVGGVFCIVDGMRTVG